MKELYYSASKEWERKFASNPVRNKYDLIGRVLEVSKYIISRKEIDKNGNVGILVSKNSRVYVFESCAYFYSFCFPFAIRLEEKDQSANKLSYPGGEVTSTLIHALSIVLNSGASNNSFVLTDSAEEISALGLTVKEIEPLWLFLLTFDPGYVRYERDPEHEASNHPLYHLDWNYDNRCEVKTGLNVALTQKDFIEILSIDLPCWFLSKIKKKSH